MKTDEEILREWYEAAKLADPHHFEAYEGYYEGGDFPVEHCEYTFEQFRNSLWARTWLRMLRNYVKGEVMVKRLMIGQEYTMQQVREASVYAPKLYVSVHTPWWGLEGQLGLAYLSLKQVPSDPQGGVVKEYTGNSIKGVLDTAAAQADVYGKHGIRAFLVALHGVVVELKDGKEWPACLNNWDEYNALIDIHDAQAAEDVEKQKRAHGLSHMDRHRFDGARTASGVSVDTCVQCHWGLSHSLHFTDAEIKAQAQEIEANAYDRERVAFYAEMKPEASEDSTSAVHGVKGVIVPGIEQSIYYSLSPQMQRIVGAPDPVQFCGFLIPGSGQNCKRRAIVGIRCVLHMDLSRPELLERLQRTAEGMLTRIDNFEAREKVRSMRAQVSKPEATEVITRILEMRKLDLQKAKDPRETKGAEYYFGRAHRCDDILFLLGHEEKRSTEAPRPGTDASPFSAGADHKCCVRNCQSKKTTACSRYCAPQKRDMLTYLCSQHEFDSTAFIETWIEKCGRDGCLKPPADNGMCLEHCVPDFGKPTDRPRYHPSDSFRVEPSTANATFEIKAVDFSALEKQLLEVIDAVWQEKDKLISKFNREASILRDQQASLLNTRDILRAHQKK